MIRIISRIDIKNEYAIKGIQLEGLRKLKKSPNEFALDYYNQEIDEIIFIDVVASYYDRTSLYNIIDKVSKNIFIPITICGGIRKIEDVEKLLLSGADKVAINTSAILNPNILKEASKLLGSQSVISSIEAKKCGDKWIAYFDNGRESSGKDVLEWLKIVQDMGVGEILLTSIDRDGTRKGMDVELIEEVSKIVKVPLIISSGVGKLEHLDFIKNINVDAIAIGYSLHYNNLTVKEIKNYLFQLGIEVRK